MSCQATASMEAITVFSGNSELIPSDGSKEADAIWDGKAVSPGLDGSEFRHSISSVPSGSSHTFPFQLSELHSCVLNVFMWYNVIFQHMHNLCNFLKIYLCGTM